MGRDVPSDDHDHDDDEATSPFSAHDPGWDPVAEDRALAQMRARLFGESTTTPRLKGRYEVGACLGSGSTGTVYRALDCELQRPVAIKVFASRASTSRGRQWPGWRVMREAQTLARLSHPNVVTVHDVATVRADEAGPLLGGADEGVFMVMELVEGIDLRRWLTARAHPWRATLDLLMDVGRGIAAAHGAGIVHRDVKPANIVVDDAGHACLIDFGLAYSTDAGPASVTSDEEAGTSRTGGILSTAEGVVLGTPAYMAPEQHHGDAPDARSDQYAFCTTLYEALYSVRPFRARTADGLCREKEVGPPPPPRQAGVPGRFARIVRRGLAPDPADRFASMDDLLDALVRAQHAPRRRWVAAAATTTLVAAVAGTAWVTAPTRCEVDPARIAAAYGDDARAGLAAALGRVDHPDAAAQADAVTGRLDAWVGRWSDAHETVCEAIATDEGRTLAQLCLDRQLRTVGQVVALLSREDRVVATHAQQLVSELPDPDDCRDPDGALADDLPLAQLDDPRVVALDAEAVEANLLHDAGQYAEARSLARRVAADAESVGAYRIQARALQIVCYVESEAPDGIGACEELLRAGERADSPEHVVTALYSIAWAAIEDGRIDEAERLHVVAKARLEGTPDHAEEAAELLFLRGHIELARGEAKTAVKTFEEVVAAYQRNYGPDHAYLLEVYMSLAMALNEAGDVAGARGVERKALAMARRVVGPTHPMVGSLEQNLAVSELRLGDYDAAVAGFRRALVALRATHGPGSADAALVEMNLGLTLLDLERHDEGVQMLEQALATYRGALGAEHHDTAYAMSALAEGLRRAGRTEAAVSLAEQARDTMVRLLPPEHVEVCETEMTVADTLRDAGRGEAAIPIYERVVDKLAERRPQLYATALSGLGRTYAGLGRTEDATRTLRKAQRVLAGVEHDPKLAEEIATALAALPGAEP